MPKASRGAPSPKPLVIELALRGTALALEVADCREPVPSSLDERILTCLANADQSVQFADLRAQLRVRAATLITALAITALEAARIGRIER